MVPGKWPRRSILSLSTTTTIVKNSNLEVERIFRLTLFSNKSTKKKKKILGFSYLFRGSWFVSVRKYWKFQSFENMAVRNTLFHVRERTVGFLSSRSRIRLFLSFRARRYLILVQSKRHLSTWEEDLHSLNIQLKKIPLLKKAKCYPDTTNQSRTRFKQRFTRDERAVFASVLKSIVKVQQTIRHEHSHSDCACFMRKLLLFILQRKWSQINDTGRTMTAVWY